MAMASENAGHLSRPHCVKLLPHCNRHTYKYSVIIVMTLLFCQMWYYVVNALSFKCLWNARWNTRNLEQSQCGLKIAMPSHPHSAWSMGPIYIKSYSHNRARLFTVPIIPGCRRCVHVSTLVVGVTWLISIPVRTRQHHTSASLIVLIVSVGVVSIHPKPSSAPQKPS